MYLKLTLYKNEEETYTVIASIVGYVELDISQRYKLAGCFVVDSLDETYEVVDAELVIVKGNATLCYALPDGFGSDDTTEMQVAGVDYLVTPPPPRLTIGN